MPSDLTGPAAALAVAMAPEFDILRPLGEGSMGAAYLARERELRRLVTIKVPRSDIAASDVVRHRFEREARAAARIRHPSAAAVHRIGRLPDGTPFLVLEYLEGRTLEDVLAAEGPLPVPVALTILRQLAEALAAAHAEGVVHRDVRPNNIFWLEDDGRAVLADFGMAGILESGAEVVTRLTRPGEPSARRRTGALNSYWASRPRRPSTSTASPSWPTSS
jgi:eukaryotic-like serine/threonine-protein kinase